MNPFSDHVLTVLWFLLPGFVAAWVHAGVTAYPKPSDFERVIQALIFTALTQPMVYVIREILARLSDVGLKAGEWTDTSDRIWSIVIALMLGLLFARWSNHDTVHRLLRTLNFTKQTGYPSEWFGAFKDRGRTFVVLHLDGQRRLYGWPEEWPLESTRGHFSMAQASWLGDDGSETPLKGVARVLIPATEVVFVEFMEVTNASTSASGQPEHGRA